MVSVTFQMESTFESLTQSKRRHNFIDTPRGICHCNQGIEDAIHFLFSFLTFVNQQAALLVISVNENLRKISTREASAIVPIWSRIYISWNNKLILMSTIKYIKETQRFST